MTSSYSYSFAYLHERVIRVCVADNYIDGREFFQLTQQDLKEVIPAVGITR